MDWIKITDKLPELGQIVLAVDEHWCENQPTVCEHRGDGFMFDFSVKDGTETNTDIDFKAEAWMPIPEYKP